MSKRNGPDGNSGNNTKVIQRMYLENINHSKNHYKFYQVDLCYCNRYDKYVVEATWGRIDTPGTYMVKAQGKVLDDVVDQMDKVLLQKLFKKGYEMVNIERWPGEARAGEEDRFINEDWD